MEHFDKKHDALFNQFGEQDIPAGFEWSSMKDGIDAKMPKKDKKRRFLPLLLLFIAITSPTAILLLDNDNQGTNQNNETLNIVQKNSEVKISPNFNKNYAEDDTKLNQNIVAVNSAEKTNIPNGTKPKISIKNRSAIVEKSSLVNQSRTHADVDLKNEADNKTSKPNTTHTQISTPAINNGKINKKDQMLLVSSVALLPSIKPVLSFDEKLYTLDLLISQNSPTIDTPKKSSKRLDLMLTSGANLWKHSYQTNGRFAQLRSDSTNQLVGKNIAIHLTKQLSSKFSLGASLGYSSWASKFKANHTRDVSVTVNNHLVTSTYNVITRATTNSYADVNVASKESRNVIHYNQIDVLTGSLTASYKITNNKLNIYPTASFGLDYMVRQSGKTFAENEYIIDLSNKLKYVDEISLNTGVGIQAKYMINDKFYISALIEHKQTLGNISTMGLRAKTSRTSLGIGIGYRL